MKVHRFPTFDSISIYMFLITLYFFIKNRKEEFFANFKKPFYFLCICLLTFLLLKINYFGESFANIISRTYVRRFLYFGIYPYLLFSVSIYFWYKYILFKKLDIKLNKKTKRIIYSVIPAFLIIAVISLFIFHSDNNKYNHSYIMRKKNVFTFINKNIPKWNNLCSYGYPALMISSQTPNYILDGFISHMPQVGGGLRRQIYNFILLKMEIPLRLHEKVASNFKCRYILLENNRNIYDTAYRDGRKESYFSLIFTRKKLSYLDEKFKKIYKDDKYSLYYIKPGTNLNEFQHYFKNRAIMGYNLYKLDESKKIFLDDAYKSSIKILLNKRLVENYTINEKIRNEIYRINPEEAGLTHAFSMLDIYSNTPFKTFPNDLEILLDLDGYPEIKDKYYIYAEEEIKDNKIGQAIEVDFYTIRYIHDIEIKWLDKKTYATDFSIEYFSNGKYKKLIRIQNNEKLSLRINEKNIKISKMKITVYKAGQNRFIMKSLMIR